VHQLFCASSIWWRQSPSCDSTTPRSSALAAGHRESILFKLYLLVYTRQSTALHHVISTNCASQLRVPERISFKLAVMSYDVSIHPWHLSVLPTVVFRPCFRHDIQITAAVFYLCIVGKRALPVSGATIWNDLPLHVASAPSLAVFRQERLNTFCFPVPTKTLSYDSCVTINIQHYCLD